MPSSRVVRNLILWPLLLAAVGAIVFGMWWFSMAGRIERLIWEVRSPEATIGYQGWVDLRTFVRNEWGAVAPTLSHADSPEPIAFHISRSTRRQTGKVRYPFVALPRAIGTEGKIICDTVGEAIQAMAYNEGRWRTDLRDDDIAAWWAANKAHYIHDTSAATKMP